MEVLDDLAGAALRQETILTIGIFDGVHRGHQELIRQVVERARETDCLSGLLTFHPHPAAVLNPKRVPPMLTTPGEKVALFAKLNVDLVVLLPFTRELAETSARSLVEELVHRLRLRELWVGSDFALGHRREGDVPQLRTMGQELGFEVHEIAPVLSGGSEMTTVSSSRIRAFLLAGEVEEAAKLLGRYPSLCGEVVVGAQRGRELGFPTANLEVRPERAVPANGVYAVYASLGTERHTGVANVGIRPSFDNGHRVVETHILDFDRDIYGCDLVVEFVARLRDERRFDDINDLVDQIQLDCEQARLTLARMSPTGMGAGRRSDFSDALTATSVSQAEDTAADAEEWPGDRVPDGCGYRVVEVEHTADRALSIRGTSLPLLFVGAARGMIRLMADIEGLVVFEWREIRLEAIDQESLLVEWLNELLFLAETEGLLAIQTRIHSLSGNSLVARVGLTPGEPAKTHIKAATFHNMALLRDGEAWSTVVTFDV